MARRAKAEDSQIIVREPAVVDEKDCYSYETSPHLERITKALSKDERLEAGDEMIILKEEIKAKEEELEAYKSTVKGEIKSKEGRIQALATEYKTGKRSEEVECLWRMNDPVPGIKSLYRLDKQPMELVRTGGMTPSDRQVTIEQWQKATGQEVTERTVEEKFVTPIINEPYDEDMEDVEPEENFEVEDSEECSGDENEAEAEPEP